ncbi:ComEC/Rec2 family competence protein [Cellulomonas sp. JH27-2]|uniref:ComEC/Rec2 family competence protein n=1 Tax=Cellulomonas sp. JH27-2 TaxID=2774139 RepID=UPI00177D6F2F|nr:ComEC/Rec2 family competence protein [Cellulomonas sp. JH27-2]
MNLPGVRGAGESDLSSPPERGLEVLDLRLAPSAAVAWLAAMLVVRVPAPCGLVAALVCASTAGVVLGVRARTSTITPTVALALLVAAITAGTGAAQVASRESGRWADRVGAEVAVTGVVSGDPTALPAAWPGAPARASWLLTVESVAPVQDTAAAQRAHAPVRVLGPAGGGAFLGARVALVGVLRDTPRGERAVALLIADRPVRVLARAGPWWRAGEPIRTAEQRLAQSLTGDARALLPGVTVGDTSSVPPDLTDALRVAGLTHLTAVSGAHFSLVAMLALAGAGLARVPRRARAPVVLAAMVAMVLVVHPSPSVLRAAVMGLVGVWALLLDRPARAPAALAASVVVLLVIDPWLAGEVGFALSVLATAGIVVVAQPLAVRWSRWGRRTATVLAVPVAAQLLCAPVIVLLNPTLSLYAVPANLVAGPAVAPATVLGLGAGVVEPWCHPLAQALAWAAGGACWWIGAVARCAAALPGARTAWLPGVVGAAVLAIAGVCVARLLLRPRR